MMRAAPEMSPTLDDAIVALDGGSVNGVISREQLATVRAFLEQLNDVRDVPPVLLDRAQGAALEGAYQSGVRVADESGHVLVVSLPALLGPLQPVPRPTFWGRLRQVWARWVGAGAGTGCTCGRHQHAEPEQHEPGCAILADAYVGAREDAAIWKKRALEAEAKLRKPQLDLVFSAVAPDPLRQAMRERQERYINQGMEGANAR